MILVCGVPYEQPLALVCSELLVLGLPYVLIDQQSYARVEFELAIVNGICSGRLSSSGRKISLEELTGVYMRLLPPDVLPVALDQEVSRTSEEQCRSVLDFLLAWTEVSTARIVNRASAMSSNSSKTYQSQLIRKHGFSIPDTLVTNDPDLALAFHRRHPRAIYKSISSARSIVRALRADDLGRLESIVWCPVQFQEYIPGVNLRVHTVGQAVFASQIVSDAVDYRYAHYEGRKAEIFGVALSDELSEACVSLARALHLDFSGIDLITTADGRTYCLEVNPSPAFNYYELRTGQPIARQLALYLAGRSQ